MCIQTIVVAKLDVDVGIDVESFVVVLLIGGCTLVLLLFDVDVDVELVVVNCDIEKLKK